MNQPTDIERDKTPILPMITLSDDGYVRMTVAALRTTPLVHLLSGVDEDASDLPWEGASCRPISGYTEWVSVTTPVITLGWDWRVDVSTGRPHYERLGAPRSNVMLIDGHGQDLGFARTAGLIEAFVDAFCWQEDLHQFIVTRYK